MSVLFVADGGVRDDKRTSTCNRISSTWNIPAPHNKKRTAYRQYLPPRGDSHIILPHTMAGRHR